MYSAYLCSMLNKHFCSSVFTFSVFLCCFLSLLFFVFHFYCASKFMFILCQGGKSIILKKYNLWLFIINLMLWKNRLFIFRKIVTLLQANVHIKHFPPCYNLLLWRHNFYCSSLALSFYLFSFQADLCTNRSLRFAMLSCCSFIFHFFLCLLKIFY